MEMPEAQSIANRDEPIPILVNSEAEVAPKQASGFSSLRTRSDRMQEKVKGKLQDAQGRFQAAQAEALSARTVQDKVFSMLFQQVFPQDIPEVEKPSRRSPEQVQRPGFSLPTMSTNFRRFNARIGVVFVGQARAIRLLSWRQPTQTLSFLAVYTFCCLDPSLLAVLPLAICLLAVMIPAFIARHPPPPNSLSTDAYNIQGPASAKPADIKPAPEMSKDFFRNMRDLQNSMEDFSVVHDQLVSLIAPVTNFSDQRISSTVFLLVFLTSAIAFLASSLLPWRLICLALGWLAVCSTHPVIVRVVQSIDKAPIRRQLQRAQSEFHRWVLEDIILDSEPEKREVEIFELQRKSDQGWVPWVYALSPYTPRSPLRVSGDRPRGTRFFEDVKPPRGWIWSSKKWTLDLLSRDWVEERMITAVEVEMEGERWVYDIGVEGIYLPRQLQAGSNEEYGSIRRDWEEGSGLEAKGEWRRRRWVRRVQRKTLKGEAASNT